MKKILLPILCYAIFYNSAAASNSLELAWGLSVAKDSGIVSFFDAKQGKKSVLFASLIEDSLIQYVDKAFDLNFPALHLSKIKPSDVSRVSSSRGSAFSPVTNNKLVNNNSEIINPQFGIRQASIPMVRIDNNMVISSESKVRLEQQLNLAFGAVPKTARQRPKYITNQETDPDRVEVLSSDEDESQNNNQINPRSLVSNENQNNNQAKPESNQAPIQVAPEKKVMTTSEAIVNPAEYNTLQDLAKSVYNKFGQFLSSNYKNQNPDSTDESEYFNSPKKYGRLAQDGEKARNILEQVSKELLNHPVGSYRLVVNPDSAFFKCYSSLNKPELILLVKTGANTQNRFYISQPGAVSKIALLKQENDNFVWRHANEYVGIRGENLNNLLTDSVVTPDQLSLPIGEATYQDVLVSKGWKTVTVKFGQDSFNFAYNGDYESIKNAVLSNSVSGRIQNFLASLTNHNDQEEFKKGLREYANVQYVIAYIIAGKCNELLNAQNKKRDYIILPKFYQDPGSNLNNQISSLFGRTVFDRVFSKDQSVWYVAPGLPPSIISTLSWNAEKQMWEINLKEKIYDRMVFQNESAMNKQIVYPAGSGFYTQKAQESGAKTSYKEVFDALGMRNKIQRIALQDVVDTNELIVASYIPEVDLEIYFVKKELEKLEQGQLDFVIADSYYIQQVLGIKMRDSAQEFKDGYSSQGVQIVTYNNGFKLSAVVNSDSVVSTLSNSIELKRSDDNVIMLDKLEFKTLQEQVENFKNGQAILLSVNDVKNVAKNRIDVVSFLNDATRSEVDFEKLRLKKIFYNNIALVQMIPVLNVQDNQSNQ